MCSFFSFTLFAIVGRGEWLWWRHEPHQNIPSLQCAWAQPEQLATQWLHPTQGCAACIRRDEIHSAWLQQHSQHTRFLQRDIQPLLLRVWLWLRHSHQPFLDGEPLCEGGHYCPRWELLHAWVWTSKHKSQKFWATVKSWVLLGLPGPWRLHVTHLSESVL